MIEIARLHKLDSNSALKAFADVAIGQVLVKGVRIVEGKTVCLSQCLSRRAKMVNGTAP